MSSARTRRRKQIKNVTTTQHAKKHGLHEKLEEEDILAIHTAFQNAPSKTMHQAQLRKALSELCKIEYSDDEFNTFFLKVNQGR